MQQLLASNKETFVRAHDKYILFGVAENVKEGSEQAATLASAIENYRVGEAPLL